MFEGVERRLWSLDGDFKLSGTLMLAFSYFRKPQR